MQPNKDNPKYLDPIVPTQGKDMEFKVFIKCDTFNQEKYVSQGVNGTCPYDPKALLSRTTSSSALRC